MVVLRQVAFPPVFSSSLGMAKLFIESEQIVGHTRTSTYAITPNFTWFGTWCRPSSVKRTKFGI